MGRARTTAVSGAGALCCLFLNAAACSSEREGGTSSAAGSGSGSSSASGGSAGNAGSTSLDVGNYPDCPELEPVEGDSCDLSGWCHYPDACGDGAFSLWE